MSGLSSATAVAEGVALLVEGRAEIVKEDEALARSEAVRDALEKALLRVAERIVTDKNYTDKLGAVKEALAGRVDRYIGNYRIVSENRHQDCIQVEAQFCSRKLLGEDLIQMGFCHSILSGRARPFFVH